MDERTLFAISASGLIAEKTRLDVAAANIANINSGRDAAGKLYQPLRVLTAPLPFAQRFGAALGGVRVSGIEAMDVPPRLIYEPGSPDADERGYVARPGVDHLGEMVSMSSALRAYQANVAAFNTARAMAQKALELGGGQ